MCRWLVMLVALSLALSGCAPTHFESWADGDNLYLVGADGTLEYRPYRRHLPPVRGIGRWTLSSNNVIRADLTMYRAVPQGDQVVWRGGDRETSYVWLEPTPPPCRRFDNPEPAARFGAYKLRQRTEYRTGQPTLPPERSYKIDGAVLMPGEHEWIDGMTLIDAVVQAGGTTFRARRGAVTVRRGTNYLENVGAILRGEAPDIRIEAQDRIWVPSGW